MTTRDYAEEVAKRVEWIKGLIEKSGTKGIALGISGGVDSAVTAVLCQKAVGDNFLGLILPIESNPVHQRDAGILAEKFGMRTVEIELTEAYRFLAETIGKSLGEELGTLAKGNMKARMRMIADYALANQLGYLVAGTDNLSETVAGYFTKYGDGAVDFLPISDLTKREVYEMAAYLGIPEEIMTKPPSADLWHGQTDEEELGVTYDDIEAYIKGQLTPDDPRFKIIDRLNKSSEHKRELPAAYEG